MTTEMDTYVVSDAALSEALHRWERAQKGAELDRQAWKRGFGARPGPSLVQRAFDYANAADFEAECREAYEGLVMERLAEERRREQADAENAL
jgi:hypothetical protein